VTKHLPTAEHVPLPPRTCHAVVLTPRGRGAVATVVVDGPDATAIVDQLFQSAVSRCLGQFPCDRVVFGYWRAPLVSGEASACRGEEVVVCRRGAERIEIHCHGGSAAVDHVLATLAAAGCRTLSAADWMLGRASDRLIAEARLALARARTLRVAAVLLDQYRGALSRSVAQAIDHISAGRLPAAQHTLHTLLAWWNVGRRLINPWQIALVGKTNAGKSSLLNALLGYQRSLVDRAAGTTRDVLTAVTAVAGWPVELADTAGSRAAASALESEGISRATRRGAAADLVLVVSDVSTAWSEEDDRWVRIAPHALIIVHNKCDLVASVPPDRPTGVATSARTAAGLSELLDVVAKRLVPNSPAPGTAVPFLEHHRQGLSLALQSLQEGADERARRFLH
jgi:tRNA modification GTPase